MTTVEIDIDLDSLGPKDLEVLGIPRHCPAWCTNSHRQAVEEGCDAESARVHRAADFAGRTNEVHGERFTWDMELLADPGPDNTWTAGQPFIDLELAPFSGATGTDLARRLLVRLDTGSARIIARQLEHLADRGDLHI